MSDLRELHLKTGRAVKEAWERKDTSLLAEVLAERLEWRESVFGQPLTTPKDVLAVWDAEVPAQTDVKVDIELLDFVDNRGYHRCRASWQDARGPRRVDAIFVIHLNPTGQITHFTPWYENALTA